MQHRTLTLPVVAALFVAAPLTDPVHAAGADSLRAPAAAETLKQVVPVSGVEVSTTRAGDRIPVARSVVDRDALRQLNVGQDIPMAVAQLPGAYAYSDAGNGIGYSYLAIRGFPQRRISVLVNGVPLNDPQSHEVYWVDHPDLLASASELQVQRGVGSALYGAASLGGTVNIETSPFTRSAEVSALAAYGSWETKRLMIEGNSGDLDGGWNLYGRYSRIETHGYRDDAFSRLWSYSLAARRRAGAHTWRVNLYGGPEETRLTYLAVPSSYMNGEITGDADRDRRFNPLTYPNERDHFFEPHYELMHDWAPAANLAVSQTMFFFDGRGFFDEQRFGRGLAEFRLPAWQTSDSTLFPRGYYRQDGSGGLVQDGQGRFTVERFDLVRRRTVANRHYGWVPRARLQQPWGRLTFGGELRAADGRHYGEITSGNGLPPGTTGEHRYYDYHPRTFTAAAFARAEWEATAEVMFTGDLSWRHQSYAMRGDAFDAIRFDQSYDFVNPRAGVTWTPTGALTAFASYARSSREPSFRDLYDAEGVGATPLYRVSDTANNVYIDPLVRPEDVDDFELGATWRGDDATVSANMFRMNLRDELVFAGQFNTDLGYATVGNAARSVHQGIELAGQAARRMAPGVRVRISGNASLSDNHFEEYQEVYGTASGDTIRYDGNALGFFPSTIAHASVHVDWDVLTLGASADHAGRIYLDNNEDMLASIGPRTVLNLLGSLRLAVGASSVAVTLRVNNVLDEKYATSGYMDFDSAGNLAPHFIPAATRSVLAEVRVDF